MCTNLIVGSVVGARRWPCEAGHPETWLPPHRGVLLARDDPRAWRHSVLGEEPSREAIRAHLEWCDGQLLAARSHPVLWEFSPHQAMWEAAATLLPYEADLAAWQDARERAMKGKEHAYVC